MELRILNTIERPKYEVGMTVTGREANILRHVGNYNSLVAELLAEKTDYKGSFTKEEIEKVLVQFYRLFESEEE